jgi:hypothetical protein
MKRQTARNDKNDTHPSTWKKTENAGRNFPVRDHGKCPKQWQRCKKLDLCYMGEGETFWMKLD